MNSIILLQSRRCLSWVYLCLAPCCDMGRALSRFFQSGSKLLSAGNHRGVSEETRKRIRTIFDAIRANPQVTVERLDGILSQIPKNENVLLVHNEEGYNLLQKCVGINNIELVRWIIARNVDLNRGACSLPLHIACYKGYEECVAELRKHGARMDVEARMCWPGPHSNNCSERGKHQHATDETSPDRGSDKLQPAIFYCIDGDAISGTNQKFCNKKLSQTLILSFRSTTPSQIVNILQTLMGSKEDQSPFSQKRPLLHVACERAAWNCAKLIVAERSEEINMCFDEYYPVHHAVMHHVKFLQLLIANHASLTVVTQTEQMTLLHILFMLGRKTAEDTLRTCKVLLEHGLRELINAPDSLGNTPLHGLIVRYSLEESRYGYQNENQPWNKWDMMHLVRYLLQNGARPSINQQGNSALAYVLRHIKDLEFRYDLLQMLLQYGGDPNVAGRDGSVPLMVCLVPLINKDPLNQFTHSMKVCYLNCLRILCKHGANPNCTSRSNLTPLHVLVFTASENIALSRQNEKTLNFEFIRNLLILLLQYGLDPNAVMPGATQISRHILRNIVEMVKNTRIPTDLDNIYDLMLTLIQYGADPNVQFKPPPSLLKRSLDVLSYYVYLISRRNEILLDSQARFARILTLLYMCMSHDALYSSLRKVCPNSLSAPESNVEPLSALLRCMTQNPRTLKQLARVCIHTALNRRPGPLVSKLNLPNILREYILNFEP